MKLHLDSLCMDAYLDGTLSAQEAEKTARHLEECPSCRTLLEARGQLLAVLSNMPDEEAPELLRPRLEAALRSEKDGEARRILRRRKVVPTLLTAAACLVITAGILTLWVGGGFTGIAQGVAAADTRDERYAADSESGRNMDNAASFHAYEDGAGDGDIIADMAEAISEESMTMDSPAAAPADLPAEDELSVKDDTAAGGLTDGSLLTRDLQTVSGQKLVYRAEVSAETTAFDADLSAILKVCDTYNGFVEYSSVYGKAFTEPDGYGRYAYLTLRIPSSRYHEAALGLKGIGSLRDFSENVTNITYEYNNADILLENLLAQRDTLLELLDKAESLDDVVLLQSELNDLSTRIQQAESQVRGMDNEIDYATFSVSLEEVEDASTLLASNESKSFFQRMQERLYASLAGIRDGFLEGVIDLVAFLPVLAAILLPLGLLGLIVWLILRGAKRRKARRAA
ncbi:MAG: DUF4349 domain-containing protein [Christensenellales bacterium]|jgi:anti-sigma factor RsiW